jgi:hypothetical protein
MELKPNLSKILSQFYEGSFAEALIKRLLRLVFWILLFTPLILVPVWYLLLAPTLGPIFGPAFAPLLKP